jgi:glutamate-ammonia-ligase adenylyltransferase
LRRDEAETLTAGYRLFDDIQHWQRLMIEGPFTEATATPAVRQRLAAAVGLPDEAVLLQHLAEERGRCHQIFNRVLGERRLTRPERQ